MARMDIRAALADLIGMVRPLENLAGGNGQQRAADAESGMGRNILTSMTVCKPEKTRRPCRKCCKRCVIDPFDTGLSAVQEALIHILANAERRQSAGVRVPRGAFTCAHLRPR